MQQLHVVESACLTPYEVASEAADQLVHAQDLPESFPDRLLQRKSIEHCSYWKNFVELESNDRREEKLIDADDIRNCY
eukprot:s10047_g3.t1